MIKHFVLPAILVSLFSSSASAATFDFIEVAKNNERGYSTYTQTVDGINLSATGWYNGNQVSAYFDDHWSGYGDAGLGVCQNLSGSNQCNPGNDDNVTIGEELRLDFGQTVKINSLTMANGEHHPIFDGTFNLTVDGVNLGNIGLAAALILNKTGQVFSFLNNNQVASPDKEFYISTLNVSAVPVPAALFLFAPAVLGFIGLRRKAQASIA